MNPGIKWIVAIAVLAVILFIGSKMEGPTITNLRMGSMQGTNILAQVTSPGGRFAGVAIEFDRDAVPLDTAIDFTLSKDGRKIISLGCKASNLVETTWIHREAYRLPLESAVWVKNYADELKNNEGLQIEMTFDRAMETNTVIWLRFVDSRWLKDTPAGIRSMDMGSTKPHQ